MRIHYPRFVSAVLCALLLYGCSGSSTAAVCTELVWIGDDEIGVCPQTGWEEVSQEMLQEKQVPEETIAVFRLAEKRSGQRDNLVISREELDGTLTSVEYAKKNIFSIQTTPDYALVDTKEITIDETDALLHVFTARPVSDLPARRFYQLSLSNNGYGYTITASLPFSTPKEIEAEVVKVFETVTMEKSEVSE